jgi:hypothetical protein
MLPQGRKCQRMTKSWESYLEVELKNLTVPLMIGHAMPRKQTTTIKTRDITLNLTSTPFICLGLVETNLNHENELPWNPRP